MQGLVYTGTNQMALQTVEKPHAMADEVLLKVLYCGICGSDRHAYHGKDARRVPPLILGHEAVGEDDSGNRYIVNPLITCTQCPACLSGRANLCAQRQMISMARPGAFADYLAMPRRNLLPLPPALSAAEAALAEPAACAWRTVNLARRQLSVAPALARALVIGAGAIGLLSALALSRIGCRPVFICDTQAARLAVAADMGITTLAADEVPDNTFDMVIDAVGSGATRASASRAAAAGGVIGHIGLENDSEGLDARRLTLQEIAFLGSYTYTPAEFAQTVALLADGAFGEVMRFSCIRPLAEGAQAFADLDAGDAAAKILLQP